METFNDLDFIFLLIDIVVLLAGVFAVAAWYVDHRRQAQRERGRPPLILQGE
jgi:flagellar basal body-associated protein FliL